MKNFVRRGTSFVLVLVMLLLLLPLGAAADAVAAISESSDVIPVDVAVASETESTVPMIKYFTNITTGTVISWDAVEGAAKYRVYYINANGAWQGLGNTTTTSFTHDKLVSGTTYTYTLRVLDENNVAVSDFYQDGFKNTFYASPDVTSLSNTASGVEVKWASVEGIDNYRVYKNVNGSVLEAVADVKGNSYVDSDVASGNKYTYSVRCLNADLKVISAHKQVRSITFFEAPVITSTYNTLGGTKISWLKVNGASKYRVYYINDKGAWQGLGNTTSTNYTHNGLTAGKTYTYTVRCLDSKGVAISDFNREGVSNTYLAPVVVSSLSNTTEGVKVTWSVTDGISTYRLFRKTNGGSWVKVADVSGTSYIDSGVTSGNKYTYTLRCLDSKGAFVSYHNQGKSINFFESPRITSASSTATGIKISWGKVNGAAKYRVYYINEKGVWQGLSNTTTNSYEHKNLTAGKTYTYTVRVLNSAGTALSDFERQGVSAVFYQPPVISSLANTTEGVSVKWNSINGINTYRLYRRTNGSAWEHIGDINGTSYTDKNVSSGNQYAYTTRCMDSQGKLVSTHNQGKSITFFEAPDIKKIVNDSTSATITWNAVKGAAKYRVYYVNSAGNWEGLGNTTTTSFRHQNLKDGVTYTYTVRVLNSSNTAVSDFDRVGTSVTFYKAPEITSVTKADNGYKVQWNSRSGVASYRLFKRTIGSSWETIATTTSNYYIDTNVKNNVVYTYTLRYLDGNGNYISGYLNETKYYYNGELANGTINVNGTNCYFNNGLFRSGYQRIGGNDYYYGANGAVMKNGIVGSDKDGWRYADSTGKIDYTYCNGVTQHGYNWVVINGKAQKVVTESDKTLFRAAKEVAKVTKPSMTKQQKLKACFDYCKKAYSEYNPRVPHYKGMDWPIVYANDMFVGGGGNCFSYGAAFAYMAKAIGYTEVYACHSGGHGWAEIDGLVYDPEWSKHRNYHTYFALSYDIVYDQNYKAAIAPGLPWMHVKI